MKFTLSLSLYLVVLASADHVHERSDYKDTYDGKTGQWDVTWDSMKSLPSPRSDFSAVVSSSSNYVYLMGRCDETQVKAPWDDVSLSDYKCCCFSVSNIRIVVDVLLPFYHRFVPEVRRRGQQLQHLRPHVGGQVPPCSGGNLHLDLCDRWSRHG